jgi:DNA polymerase-4
LFDVDQRLTSLSHTLDQVNRAYGPNAAYFGGMFGHTAAAPLRIAFNHIPDVETESGFQPRSYGYR